jgi:polyhydroxybutyrate depolymerase
LASIPATSLHHQLKTKSMMKTQLWLIVFTLVMSVKHYAQTRMIKANDTIRQFTIYSSSKIKADEKVPLLLNFHGSGMTALEHMFYTNTNALAEEKGFIVVYPQGLNNDWNVGFEQDYDHGTKDVEFIEILIQKLQKHYPVDVDKIYATGLSRGGFFVQRLVAELPNTVNGFVSIGAPMPNEVKNRMQSTEKVKAMYVHGTADEVVSVEGMEGEYLSILECLDYWKKRNEVMGKASISKYDTTEDGTSIEVEDYVSIVFMSIEDGGHTWPNSDSFNVGFPLGKTTKDINFNEYIYNFLFQ